MRWLSNLRDARKVCISGPDAQVSATTRAVYATVANILFLNTHSGFPISVSSECKGDKLI